MTRLGALLRATSLDELPEMWNLLKGEMSLVGPRPLFPEYLPFYTPRERLRHTVRPGITGLAQVSGRNAISWNDRLELDTRYVENWKLLDDLKIILRTIKTVLGREGVSAEGHVTMQRLDDERTESNHHA
jgi:lipopolysaccharide/colanic/teichoic acid biosynthesis glycosyltransferase